MHVTIATIISTVLLSSAFMLILIIIMKFKYIYNRKGITLVTFISFMVVVRIFIPVEFTNYTITIPSKSILPFIFEISSHTIIDIFNQPVTIWNVLCGIWFIGIIYNIRKLFIAYMDMRNIMHLPKAKNTLATIVLDKILGERHLFNKKICIIESEYVKAPSLIGIFKPCILLPKDDLSSAELYFILSHEINHYIGHDNLLKLLMEVLNAFYWWNPLFYILKSNIATIIELRVDSKVIDLHPNSYIDYMQCLLKIYRRQSFNNLYPVTTNFCTETNQNLVKRFNYIIKLPNSKKNMMLSIWILIFSLGFLMASYLMVFEAEYKISNGTDKTYSIEDSYSSYILEDENRQYYLYIDNTFMGKIENIKSEAVSDLPILVQGDKV